MEITRTLSKVVDLAKLHGEFAALSPSFKGLCASTGGIGDTVRIIDADNLTPAQIDGVIAAHVPSTVDEKTGSTFDQQKLLKAVALSMIDAINQLRQNPTTTFPAITPAQAKQFVIDKYNSL